MKCLKPEIEQWRKPCGCLSAYECKTCGKTEQFNEVHHIPGCKHYQEGLYKKT